LQHDRHRTPAFDISVLATRGVLTTVLIEEMTWPELEAAVAAGKTTVVLACGATEQHGPHLPIGTDTFLGTEIAERAAKLAGNALVAPTLRPGLSDHHIDFPGTLTLRPQTFLDLLADTCTSLARHGFERIVIFPSHGGNADVMKAHVPWLARRLAETCELVFSLGTLEKIHELSAWLAERGVSIGRSGAHAGFAETSMMLAFRGELVRRDAFEAGLSDDDFYRPERIRSSQLDSFIRGIRAQSPNGVLGDPTGADAEVGEQLLQMSAEALARDLVAAPEGIRLQPAHGPEG
jgi:creatinine amidohydrolase